MTDQAARRRNWQRFKQRKRQISLSLSHQDYRAWAAIAKRSKNTVGQQIKAEAEAYQKQTRVPEAETLAKLAEHTRILRGIGNNINQIAHHSNFFGKLILRHQTIRLLRQLENAADQFIRDANTPR